MYFSTSKLVSAFMAFTVATARLHEACACNNGGAYNYRITMRACEIYQAVNREFGQVSYNEQSGRCTQKRGEDHLDGDSWEGSCREAALKGFACVDGQGNCFAKADDVLGAC